MLEIPNSSGLGVIDAESPQVPGKGPGGEKKNWEEGGRTTSGVPRGAKRIEVND